VLGTVYGGPVAGNGFSSPQLRNGRIFGVLGGSTFKLGDRDQALSTPADQAEFRRDLGVEEVGADADRRCCLRRGQGDAGE